MDKFTADKREFVVLRTEWPAIFQFDGVCYQEHLDISSNLHQWVEISDEDVERWIVPESKEALAGLVADAGKPRGSEDDKLKRLIREVLNERDTEEERRAEIRNRRGYLAFLQHAPVTNWGPEFNNAFKDFDTHFERFDREFGKRPAPDKSWVDTEPVSKDIRDEVKRSAGDTAKEGFVRQLRFELGKRAGDRIVSPTKEAIENYWASFNAFYDEERIGVLRFNNGNFFHWWEHRGKDL